MVQATRRRAALELIEAVVALKTCASLKIRIGIATGLVVVGDLMGAGNTQERGIIGETPNLVARLQGIAEPNMVIIAEATREGFSHPSVAQMARLEELLCGVAVLANISAARACAQLRRAQDGNPKTGLSRR